MENSKKELQALRKDLALLKAQLQQTRDDAQNLSYDLLTLQQEVSAARTLTESIFQTVREPMLVLDGEFTILLASQSFNRVFATDGTDVILKNLFNIQNQQWDVPLLRDLLQSVLPLVTTVEAFELKLDTSEGYQRHMVLNARKVDGSPEGKKRILLAVEDVTEQKRAERALADRETRLGAILDAAPEAIVTIGQEGIIGSFSAGAEDIFGYRAEEVIGRNVSMLMPAQDRSRHNDYLEHYLRTGKKNIIGVGREMDARRKDGSRVPIRLRVSELELDGARHFLGILHDLTADKRQKAELQRAQKMEAVGQLTGGLAHDFNNLLTVVIGNLELLELRTEDPKIHELVHEALEASNLGAAVTSQLLSFSKSQSLVPEQVALNALVQTMLPILERTLGEQIVIKTGLAGDLAATLADPGQIESAILNLALNARDAMPEGGTVTIETRNVVLNADYAALQIDVTPGDYVCLSVTDTGMGMTHETQSQAFEPFFTTKGPRAGSGLGLSMVYGFAKQSGGHVAIYSEVGQGSTLNLLLPCVRQAHEARETSPTARISETGGEIILVAEDDPKVLRLTVTRLKELNYQVITASNGPDAMKILKQRDDIDLVLSDVIMPGRMSGFDVADQALAFRPDLKILLTTGYAKDVETQDKPSQLAKHKILRKPYGLQELAHTLRELLEKAAVSPRN